MSEIKRVTQMKQTKAGALWRKMLWTSVTKISGGLTVTGNVPTKPGIIVANHTSHADTAILFASLPAKRRPVAAAAVDYWLEKWYRKTAVLTLMAIVPVERDAGGSSYELLKAAVSEKVSNGQQVLIYPEGTRTLTGEVGPFKSGAFRMAQELQIPIYPVALKGIQALFPKNGKLQRGPMEVVFGDPVTVGKDLQVEDLKALAEHTRQQVIKMKHDDVPGSKP